MIYYSHDLRIILNILAYLWYQQCMILSLDFNLLAYLSFDFNLLFFGLIKNNVVPAFHIKLASNYKHFDVRLDTGLHHDIWICFGFFLFFFCLLTLDRKAKTSNYFFRTLYNKSLIAKWFLFQFKNIFVIRRLLVLQDWWATTTPSFSNIKVN